MASSGLRKMFIQIIFNTKWCISFVMSYNIFNWTYDHLMADVKPFLLFVLSLADVVAKVFVADLIAKIMADVIAIMVWLMLLPLVLF